MKIWKAQRTLLLVGEGAHEEAFLTHVKNIYVPRGCGLHVKIKNARGKGAKHVIDWTLKQMENAAYDTCGVLLDTDTDFTSEVIRKARLRNIQLLTSEPCLEAMLLRALGKKLTSNLKKQILPFLNYNPTISENYQKYFSQKLLEDFRKNEKTINNLLALLEDEY
jgi:hypothetical protein